MTFFSFLQGAATEVFWATHPPGFKFIPALATQPYYPYREEVSGLLSPDISDSPRTLKCRFSKFSSPPPPSSPSLLRPCFLRAISNKALGLRIKPDSKWVPGNLLGNSVLAEPKNPSLQGIEDGTSGEARDKDVKINLLPFSTNSLYSSFCFFIISTMGRLCLSWTTKNK